MRNVLARVPATNTQMVIAAIRTIFAQPDAEAVREQFDRVAATLEPTSPRWPPCSKEPARTCWPSPRSPRPTGARSGRPTRSSGSTGEIKRRTDVVGVFPNDGAVLRLVTAVVVETHDEWAVAERRYLSETSMAQLRRSEASLVTPKDSNQLAS